MRDLVRDTCQSRLVMLLLMLSVSMEDARSGYRHQMSASVAGSAVSTHRQEGAQE